VHEGPPEQSGTFKFQNRKKRLEEGMLHNINEEDDVRRSPRYKVALNKKKTVKRSYFPEQYEPARNQVMSRGFITRPPKATGVPVTTEPDVDTSSHVSTRQLPFIYQYSLLSPSPNIDFNRKSAIRPVRDEDPDFGGGPQVTFHNEEMLSVGRGKKLYSYDMGPRDSFRT
jgi:hypothetical protein